MFLVLAARALYCYQRDVDYIVRGGKVSQRADSSRAVWRLLGAVGSVGSVTAAVGRGGIMVLR